MTIHHVITGSQPLTCIALHGGPGVDHSYLRSMDALGLPMRMVYADLPGHGQNPPLDPRDAAPDVFVAAVEELRANLDVDRVVLFAHSWGPSVAMDYALAYPERVAGLILASPGFETDPHDMQHRATRKSPLLASRFFGGFPGTDDGYGAWLRDVIPVYFHRFDAEVHGPHFARIVTRVAMMAFGSLGGAEQEQAAREIRAPTLVVSADDDFILPPAAGARVAKAIPRAQHVVIRDCGHFAWMEKPAEFRAAVVAWLAREVGPAAASA